MRQEVKYIISKVGNNGLIWCLWDWWQAVGLGLDSYALVGNNWYDIGIFCVWNFGLLTIHLALVCHFGFTFVKKQFLSIVVVVNESWTLPIVSLEIHIYLQSITTTLFSFIRFSYSIPPRRFFLYFCILLYPSLVVHLYCTLPTIYETSSLDGWRKKINICWTRPS